MRISSRAYPHVIGLSSSKNTRLRVTAVELLARCNSSARSDVVRIRERKQIQQNLKNNFSKVWKSNLSKVWKKQPNTLGMAETCICTPRAASAFLLHYKKHYLTHKRQITGVATLQTEFKNQRLTFIYCHQLKHRETNQERRKLEQNISNQSESWSLLECTQT